MKVSQQAHVVLSLGQRQLEIPPLEGNTLRVSRIQLVARWTASGEVSNVGAARSANGNGCVPEPKTRQGGGHPSSGFPRLGRLRGARYVMPYLIGLNEMEVTAADGPGPSALARCST